MTNTTDTYWDINGTSLNTYAFNIETLGDGRSTVPSIRGGNIEIPYRRGEVWVPKKAEAGSLTLAMWALGLNEDGTQPTYDVRYKYEENLAMLKRLMWRERELLNISKRFYRDGSIKRATAQGEFSRGLEPSMTSPARGRMTVTFNLPDPFFYGAQITETLTEGTTTIEVPGDAETYNMTIQMSAGSVIRNNSFSPGLKLGLSRNGTVDVLNKRVNGISTNTVVDFSGFEEWFALMPGNNSITVEGTATIKYKPAYF